MKEKLIIKNFGPIKSVELELGKLTVLIGEQATGKSTVAKVLAVCNYFSYFVDVNVYDSSDNSFLEGLSAWGLDESLQKDSYIQYQSKHYTLTVEYITVNYPEYDPSDGGAIEIPQTVFSPRISNPSKNFSDLLSELNRIKPKPKAEFVDLDLLEWKIPVSFFLNEVKKIMDNPFYLPAERGLQSIFSLGKSSIQNISDSLFNQLASIDQIARLFRSETFIDPLGIIYRNDNGRGYIKKATDTQFFSLFNAATGYQSIIPIVLLAKYYGEHRKKRKTFIIEEPELNLFPSAQEKLVRYLVGTCVNSDSPILLTTHSPYILTSINNLLYAYKVGEQYKEDAGKIIEEKYWLKQEDFSAYKLNPDGTCEDIFDYEEGLIKAEKIDGISSLLNKQFDALLNLEFAEK